MKILESKENFSILRRKLISLSSLLKEEFSRDDRIREETNVKLMDENRDG
jgi:hypothetical protein